MELLQNQSNPDQSSLHAAVGIPAIPSFEVLLKYFSVLLERPKGLPPIRSGTHSTTQ